MSCICTSALFPRRAKYPHMTNVCRIYQLWERVIVKIDFLLLLVVKAVILYPSDSHSILRCWMTLINAQFSKHCVSVCMFISITYQRVPTVHIPAVCSGVSYRLTCSASQPALLLEWLRRPAIRTASTRPVPLLRQSVAGLFTAEARVRCQAGPCGICGGQSGTWTSFSVSIFVSPPLPILFCQCFTSIHS